jgi:hypothetical protein
MRHGFSRDACFFVPCFAHARSVVAITRTDGRDDRGVVNSIVGIVERVGEVTSNEEPQIP